MFLFLFSKKPLRFFSITPNVLGNDKTLIFYNLYEQTIFVNQEGSELFFYSQKQKQIAYRDVLLDPHISA